MSAAAVLLLRFQAPHVSQCSNWDCGVACVQMVLRGLSREGERSSLLAALGTRSVWTIDLAMLLHRFGVRYEQPRYPIVFHYVIMYNIVDVLQIAQTTLQQE